MLHNEMDFYCIVKTAKANDYICLIPAAAAFSEALIPTVQ